MRRYGALEIPRQPAREEERSERRRKAGGLGNPEDGSKRKRGRPGGGCLSTSDSSTRLDDAWAPGPRGSEEAVVGCGMESG